MADRCYCRRLCTFYKILNGSLPQYLLDYVPKQNVFSVDVISMPAIYSIFTRTERFRNSFFPYSILQWNNLDYRIRNLPSICQFKRAILNFFRPKPSLSFQGNNQGLTFLTRLRVGFSQILNITYCIAQIFQPVASLSLMTFVTLTLTLSLSILA